MGANGGARPGAGRPKKAEKYLGPIVTAENRIAQRLPELIDNLFVLAGGVTVQEVTENGPRIYTKPPDRQANEYLLNRIMGKPTERVEHSGEDGGPIEIGGALATLSNHELDALALIAGKLAVRSGQAGEEDRGGEGAAEPG